MVGILLDHRAVLRLEGIKWLVRERDEVKQDLPVDVHPEVTNAVPYTISLLYHVVRVALCEHVHAAREHVVLVYLPRCLATFTVIGVVLRRVPVVACTRIGLEAVPYVPRLPADEAEGEVHHVVLLHELGLQVVGGHLLEVIDLLCLPRDGTPVFIRQFGGVEVFLVRARCAYQQGVLRDVAVADTQHRPAVVLHEPHELVVGGVEVAVHVDEAARLNNLVRARDEELRVLMAEVPASLSERGVVEEVVLLWHVELQRPVVRREAVGGHLDAVADVRTRVGDLHLTHEVGVDGVHAPLVQPAEQVVVDTLHVTHPGLQLVVGVGLRAVDHVHVWRVLPDGHHLHDTLSCRVAEVVYAHEGVVLGYQVAWEHALHRGDEVLEPHPVEALLPVGEVTHAHLGDHQLVALDDVAVAALYARVARLVLLHDDHVVHTERVVELAVLRVEVHLARLWVVVVHLHHGGEGAVVVLTEHLADDELEHPQRAADGQVVELSVGLRLLHACCVDVVLQHDRPARACGEARDEVLRREVLPELGVTVHLQLAQLGLAVLEQLAAAGATLVVHASRQASEEVHEEVRAVRAVLVDVLVLQLLHGERYLGYRPQRAECLRVVRHGGVGGGDEVQRVVGYHVAQQGAQGDVTPSVELHKVIVVHRLCGDELRHLLGVRTQPLDDRVGQYGDLRLRHTLLMLSIAVRMSPSAMRTTMSSS